MSPARVVTVPVLLMRGLSSGKLLSMAMGDLARKDHSQSDLACRLICRCTHSWKCVSTQYEVGSVLDMLMVEWGEVDGHMGDHDPGESNGQRLNVQVNSREFDLLGIGGGRVEGSSTQERKGRRKEICTVSPARAKCQAWAPSSQGLCCARGTMPGAEPCQHLELGFQGRSGELNLILQEEDLDTRQRLGQIHLIPSLPALAQGTNSRVGKKRVDAPRRCQ